MGASRLVEGGPCRNILAVAVDPATLRIVNYPAPILRQQAERIEKITSETQAVAMGMLALMHEAAGIGLAAPQVGLSWRLFVANPTGDPGDDQIFINPELVAPSRELVDQEEGCLSLPDVRAVIRRPLALTIRALNFDGQPFEFTSDELSARIWQHEYDHLEGILILQRMSAIDRMANRRAIRGLEAEYRV